MDTSQASLADEGECFYRFDSSTARASDAGRMWLLYDCDGDACTGAERFAEGTLHAVSLEVSADADAVLQVASSDETVASVSDIASSYDPCAERIRLWATLDTTRAGTAELVVSTAEGELDRVRIEVTAPATVELHASTLADFAFREPGDGVTVAQGDSVLVLPELRDASGMLLVGLPALTWSVDDPKVAAVRTAPGNEDESFAKKQASESTAFVDTLTPGTTMIRAMTADGVEGKTSLRVVAPEQAGAPAYAE